MKKNKVAFISGGTKGIGLSIVKRLLKKNCVVYTTYLQDDQNKENVISSFSKEYLKRLHIKKIDMSNMDEVKEYIFDISKEVGGGFDYLIFNAGGTLKKPFGEIEYNEWQKCFDTNLNVPFFITQWLKDKINKNGRIIFISSVMSIYNHSSSIAYGVSKASINSLTKYLVKYFCDKNITVNAVITGFTKTSMIKRNKEHEQRIIDKIALKRFAKPNEISKLVMDIINDGYINGSLIEIDGGYCYK
ncbi:MAG: SDR family oxidoreductase [Bacilli bacterium]